MRHPFDLSLSDLEAIASLAQLTDEEAALVNGGSSVPNSIIDISIEFPANFSFGKKKPATTSILGNIGNSQDMTQAIIINKDGTCSDEAGNVMGCNLGGIKALL